MTELKNCSNYDGIISVIFSRYWADGGHFKSSTIGFKDFPTEVGIGESCVFQAANIYCIVLTV